MSFDPSVLVTLYDPNIKKILHTIIQQKTARLKDLVSDDISEEQTRSFAPHCGPIALVASAGWFALDRLSSYVYTQLALPS